jgi:6-phosphogluconolactonase
MKTQNQFIQPQRGNARTEKTKGFSLRPSILCGLLTFFYAFADSGHLQAEPIDLYIATGGKGSTDAPSGIYHATFDPAEGKLSAPKLAVQVQHPAFLAIAPDGRHLFSASAGEKSSDVAAFAVLEGGTLKALNTQPSEGVVPCHLQTDRTGSALFVANYRDGKIAALRIKEDGSLEPSKSVHQHAGSSILPRQQGPHPHSIYPTPDNRRVFVPDLGMDKVLVYGFDPARATLKPQGEVVLPPGSGPRHLNFSTDGKHAFVLSEIGLTVSVFDLKDGLRVTQTISTVEKSEPSGMSASEIRVHPSGQFVYAANRGKGNDSIAVFRAAIGHLNKAALERLQIVPAEVRVPRSIQIDPTGRWLLACGQQSNDIAIFSIDPVTGMLTFTGEKVAASSPISIEFLPVSRLTSPAMYAKALGGSWNASTGRFYKDGNNPPISADHIAELVAFPEVKILHFNGVPIHLDQAKALGQAKHLEELLIVHVNVGDSALLSELAKIKTLKHIHVGSSNFGDEGVMILTGLPRLTTLALSHTGFDPKNPITAKGLQAVADRLPELELFYLNLHRMEDDMIPQLARLQKLRSLSIEMIDDAFLAKVQKVLPDTKVFARRGLSPRP